MIPLSVQFLDNSRPWTASNWQKASFHAPWFQIESEKAGLQWHWQHQCFALQQIPTLLLPTSRLQAPTTFLCKTSLLKVRPGTWHLPGRQMAHITRRFTETLPTFFIVAWNAVTHGACVSTCGTCGGWSFQSLRKQKAVWFCQMGWTSFLGIHRPSLLLLAGVLLSISLIEDWKSVSFGPNHHRFAESTWSL